MEMYSWGNSSPSHTSEQLRWQSINNTVFFSSDTWFVLKTLITSQACLKIYSYMHTFTKSYDWCVGIPTGSELSVDLLLVLLYMFTSFAFKWQIQSAATSCCRLKTESWHAEGIYSRIAVRVRMSGTPHPALWRPTASATSQWLYSQNSETPCQLTGWHNMQTCVGFKLKVCPATGLTSLTD